MMLTILADATPSMGAGHVMRCLALAQAAQDQGLEVRLAGRVEVPWVRERLAQEKIEFVSRPGSVPQQENPQELLDFLHDLPQSATNASAWLVFDGYHFGTDCQKAVRDAGYKLLVIDDYSHLPEYACDILLNQNIGAEELEYSGETGKKLLGPQYALLRREFRAARKKTEERLLPERPQNILLTLGGGDFSGHLAKIAPDFNIPELAGRTLKVIAGGMPEEKIRESLKDCPARLEILRRVDDMSALLLETDLCVTAGGSTCWELCCLGVPFLTVEVAENQHRIVKGLDATGRAQKFSVLYLAALLKTGRLSDAQVELMRYVDGRGCLRVLEEMGFACFELSQAMPEGSEFIWKLASAPDVRAVSLNTRTISWHEHQAWFAEKLQEDIPFFIPHDMHGKPVGYVRFAVNGATAVISIALVPFLRGKGLGTRILKVACLAFSKCFPGVAIEAFVLSENMASQKIFIAAGFVPAGEENFAGRIFIRFALAPGQRIKND